MSNFFDYLLLLGFLFISYRYFIQLTVQVLKIITGLFIARVILVMINQFTLEVIFMQLAEFCLILAIILFIYYLMRFTAKDAFMFFCVLGVIVLLFKVVALYFFLDMVYTVSYVLLIPLLIFGFFTFSNKYQDLDEIKIVTLFGIEVLIQSLTFFSYFVLT